MKRTIEQIKSRLLRVWYGSPSTALSIPFDMAQAENTLNQVLRRGTFEEIDEVFHALGTVGYTAAPEGDGHLWRLKAIEQPA